ncbi:MAG: tRNA (N(6)-L-threonylcarbamoyladenosine(37)-C(2))-methylthiotransferase MtaB [Clostridiales bacterium]|nr:tRNA (N(6)-L-threonylcarbamoyladenosine(37)-C(2))-methylthiotransferase MtaB [Clostridiales bacterium]
MSKKKVAFTTLGCKVNMYDTEAMSELFQKKGYEIVDFDKFADIYIINTCTVTNFGDKKSRQTIRRAKKINPDAIVVATGCYAQVAPDDVKKIDGINIVTGTKNRNDIVEIVENYSDKTKIINMVNNVMKKVDFENLSVNNLKGRARAYLKIQDGCDRFCSYCIIPYARGPVRSRHPDDVILEVKKLAENGYKEIVLTGIHVASYGKDLKNVSIEKILEQVHETDGIERIRLSSIEPLIVTDSFIETIKKLPKLCEHFHLSLQSGCDRTLKRMNRQYTTAEYKTAARKIQKLYPNAAITTDIIVGFPGETEEDFNKSLNFAKEIAFAKIHVFPYSPKIGTKAAEYPNQISSEIKNLRSKKLITVSNELNKKFLSNYINKEKDVLFERHIGNNIYEGHTTNYITVHAKSEKDISNKILRVKISEIIKEETVAANLLKYF